METHAGNYIDITNPPQSPSQAQLSMSSIARPPDPCLVAIILIVRSRAGPRLVFHYPPNPLSEHGVPPTRTGRRISRARTKQTNKTNNNDSESSEDSRSTSDEDEDENNNNTHAGGAGNASTRRTSNFGVEGAEASPRPGSLGSSRSGLHRKRGVASDVEEDSGAASDRQDDGSGPGPFRSPWESLLGLKADVWEKLLSPPRAWHKRRFEVGINDLAFVGWPVFVREDGTWRKQKRRREKKPPGWEAGELGHQDSAENRENEGDAAEGREDMDDVPEEQKWKHASMNGNESGMASPDPEDKDSMTMFNVVFVLDPPLLEYSTRMREVYDNIIKKFAKALKWEQARTNYVWRETQHILHVRGKLKEKSELVPVQYMDC